MPAPAPHLSAAADAELVVADWGAFFDDYLAAAALAADATVPDAIVPSPLMPHLMYEWLVRRARLRWPGRTVESRPVAVGPGTPYDVLAPDGTRYVSFADWLCPIHCIEPGTCPMIRAPRTWEMGDAMHAPRRRQPRRPAPSCSPAATGCTGSACSMWLARCSRGTPLWPPRAPSAGARRRPGRHRVGLPRRSEPAASRSAPSVGTAGHCVGSGQSPPPAPTRGSRCGNPWLFYI